MSLRYVWTLAVLAGCQSVAVVTDAAILDAAAEAPDAGGADAAIVDAGEDAGEPRDGGEPEDAGEEEDAGEPEWASWPNFRLEGFDWFDAGFVDSALLPSQWKPTQRCRVLDDVDLPDYDARVFTGGPPPPGRAAWLEVGGVARSGHWFAYRPTPKLIADAGPPTGPTWMYFHGSQRIDGFDRWSHPQGLTPSGLPYGTGPLLIGRDAGILYAPWDGGGYKMSRIIQADDEEASGQAFADYEGGVVVNFQSGAMFRLPIPQGFTEALPFTSQLDGWYGGAGQSPGRKPYMFHRQNGAVPLTMAWASIYSGGWVKWLTPGCALGQGWDQNIQPVLVVWTDSATAYQVPLRLGDFFDLRGVSDDGVVLVNATAARRGDRFIHDAFLYRGKKVIRVRDLLKPLGLNLSETAGIIQGGIAGDGTAYINAVNAEGVGVVVQFTPRAGGPR